MSLPSPPRGRKTDQPGPEAPGPPEKRLRLPVWYILVALAVLAMLQLLATGAGPKKIRYGDFRTWLKAGQVSSVTLRSDRVEGKLAATDEKGNPKEFYAVRPEGDDELYNLLDEHVGGNWEVKSDWLRNILLLWILPVVLIVILWKFLFSRANPASKMMEFGQSRARMVMQKDVGVSFGDVAGIDECKEELQEIIEFLKSPKKFTQLGGKIPKGVLLVGAPGTGKTLLAKAVAGEADVPFFSLSGSDFVEMFVGVGAARVRDLFVQANRHAPCIIFIDELDALAKTRGTGMLGGHDEREQTLNALLVQMDGFEPTKGIILLAATNRPEMLDPALLRPGRFDRHIMVPRPDLLGREAILKVHTGNVRLHEGVDERRLAAMTPGFVGADLANLVNEAALLAARRERKSVMMQDFEDAIERVVAGLEKRSRLMNEEEKEIVAHHECGHALVASLLPGVDPVKKISTVPRGLSALGYTMQAPLEDRYLLRKDELIDRLSVMLGGRSAEEIVFAEVSTGAEDDLRKATQLARQMVTRFGMSEELGLLTFAEQDANQSLVGGILRSPWSEHTSQAIDRATRSIIDRAHRQSKELLRTRKDVLLTLAGALMEKEVLDESELREILAGFGIELPERRYAQDDAAAEPEAEAEAPEEAAPAAADPPCAPAPDIPSPTEGTS